MSLGIPAIVRANERHPKLYKVLSNDRKTSLNLALNRTHPDAQRAIWILALIFKEHGGLPRYLSPQCPKPLPASPFLLAWSNTTTVMHLTDRLGTDKREKIMSIPELPRRLSWNSQKTQCTRYQFSEGSPDDCIKFRVFSVKAKWKSIIQWATSFVMGPLILRFSRLLSPVHSVNASVNPQPLFSSDSTCSLYKT